MIHPTITLPISATMRKQPDGSFEMENAEYATLNAIEVALFIGHKLGVALQPRDADMEADT